MKKKKMIFLWKGATQILTLTMFLTFLTISNIVLWCPCSYFHWQSNNHIQKWSKINKCCMFLQLVLGGFHIHTLGSTSYSPLSSPQSKSLVYKTAIISTTEIIRFQLVVSVISNLALTQIYIFWPKKCTPKSHKNFNV